MKAKTILLLVLVFIAGGVLGGFSVGQMQKKRIRDIQERRDPAVFRQHMHDVLGSTPGQEQAIDSIMAIYLPRIRMQRKEHHDLVRATHDTMLMEISKHLDSEQMEKLERFQRRFYHRRPGHHPPVDGRPMRNKE